MIKPFIRKARQLAADPVLRRWLVGKTLGKFSGEPPFTAHRPPYLEGAHPLKEEAPAPIVVFDELDEAPAKAPLHMPLPGQTLTLNPGDEASLFAKSFDDTEVLLSLHRFAWLPLLEDDIDPAWVQVIWKAWRENYAIPGDGWPWHPYTAAERAINILDFGRRFGLPSPMDDTLTVLAAHAPAIAERLEFFGDHHTSNHLSNNGRGLYLLGLELGLADATDMGAKILLEEGARIFLAGGVLREGSSHYHMLLTRNYLSAWLMALTHGRSEEALLREIAGKALAAIPHLLLPGGMPLIGDISPDCPPEFLSGLIAGEEGWVSLLDEDSKRALVSLRDTRFDVFTEDLHKAGWLKAAFGPWSGLWRAAADGWTHMPGHGHQDCGGFELHYKSEPVFIDPGRGTYGESGEAAAYRSAQAHNTVMVDGKDPYPPNKPYYNAAFRRLIGGSPPELHRQTNSVNLRHHGYARLAGVGALSRSWRFNGGTMAITDSLKGDTARMITRLFHTPLEVAKDEDGVILRGKIATFRLRADEGAVCLRPATQWLAYGEGRPITVIEINDDCGLPWSSSITLETL